MSDASRKNLTAIQQHIAQVERERDRYRAQAEQAQKALNELRTILQGVKL